MKRPPTKIGDVYGRLTVQSIDPQGKQVKSGRWVSSATCLCECGKIREVHVNDLRTGKTRGCGHHPQYADLSEPAFNNIYDHSYRGRALKNGWDFEISKPQFREMSQQPCHYCGTSPSNESYRGNRGRIKTGNRYSVFVYNGLDRVDSTRGYTMDNIVPCCGICNHAKHTMPYAAFIDWLDRITTYRKK